jgi:hypothetical protein
MTLYRIWHPKKWEWHREGRITNCLCRRYSDRTAFATAGWLAGKRGEDFVVEDRVQGLVWTVTKSGHIH